MLQLILQVKNRKNVIRWAFAESFFLNSIYRRWFSLFLICGVWLGVSLLFFMLHPTENKVSFIRFHIFLAVYGSFLGTLFLFPKGFFGLVEVLAAISVGLLFDVCWIAQEQAVNYLQIWLFLMIYSFFLWSLRSFFEIFIFLWFIPSFLFILFAIFSLAGLLLLPYMEWLGSAKNSMVSFVFYANPWLLLSSAFRDYDYLRGPFFYELYGLTSYLGPFQYPRLGLANIIYTSLGFLLLTFLKIYPRK